MALHWPMDTKSLFWHLLFLFRFYCKHGECKVKFSKKISSLFIWKGAERERKRETKDLSAASLPRWPQWQRLGWAEAGRQDLHPCLPCWLQESKHPGQIQELVVLPVPPCGSSSATFSGPLAGEMGRKWSSQDTVVHVRCHGSRQRLDLCQPCNSS